MSRILAAPAALYSPLAEDPELSDLVELFVDELPARVNHLRECFEKQEYQALTIATHQLKGAAGSYGFSPLTPILHELEQRLKQLSDLNSIRSALEEVIAWCSCVRAGVAPSHSVRR